jgi:hypothetical protein
MPGLRASRVVTNEYQETRDGFPIHKRLVLVSRVVRSPEKSDDYEKTYEFDFREGDVPESDFTLAAFGLPEPLGMAIPKKSRWYLWFIAGGVGCLLVGFFFWRRHQHNNGSQLRPAIPPTATGP